VGNVGAGAVAHIVGGPAGIKRVRNPLPALGGRDPHPIRQAKLYAPQAFRRQERAVTADDYARVTERHPEVQRAVATRRWTGSWHTIFITVDRRRGRPIDPAFESELRSFLEKFRLAGQDVEIDAPRFVALDVAIEVCAAPGHFAADVERRLLDVFSTRPLPTGELGFFHPDRLSFGTPLYLSALVARAMRVPGVQSVIPRRFRRFARTAGTALADGYIGLGRLELARLDNDPNAPENGRLEIAVAGGA
jgi:predicted phage baseplate assembly protein